MKRFLRFFALAVIGFGLGAGAAWLGNHRNTAPQLPAISAEAQKAADEAAKNAKGAPAVSTDDSGKIVIDKPVVKTGNDDIAGKVSTPAATVPDSLTGGESAVGNETLTGNAPAKDATAKTESTEKPDTAAAKVIPPSDLPPTGVGEGYFSLLDQNGNPVTEKSWPGKYLLVFFGFTHCPDICPVTLQKLSTVLEKLGDDAKKIQPLFITVDPARDTPDVLKAYLANFDKSILGLTGSEAQIKEAEDDFKVYAAKAPTEDGKGYNVNHSGFTYLMSPGGKMVELLKIEDSTDAVLNKIKPHLANPDVVKSAPKAPQLP